MFVEGVPQIVLCLQGVSSELCCVCRCPTSCAVFVEGVQ